MRERNGTAAVLSVLVLSLGACRSASASASDAAAAGAPTSSSADDQALVLLINTVATWRLVDGGVELNVPAPQLVRRGTQSDPPPPVFVLAPGETFSRVDKHFDLAFTLRELAEERLVFDFVSTHRPPHGERARHEGRVTLPLGFDPRWGACTSSADCAVVPLACGRWLGVSTAAAQFAREMFRPEVSVKKCAPGASQTSPPEPSCEAGRCRPLGP